MVQISTETAQPERPSAVAPARETARWRWWWPVVGGLLLLFAQHGNPEAGLAAWVYGVFLIRYTRAVSVVRGLIVMCIIHSVAAVAWVLSIRLPGDEFPWAALILCVLINLVLVVPFIADRLLAPRLRHRHALLSTLVYPSARVSAELLICLFSPFGMVFGLLAPTQYDELPLLQIASVTGLYGVSFLVAWAAPVVAELWQSRSTWRVTVVCGATIAAVIAGGSIALWAAPPASSTVRIAGITPSPEVSDPLEQLPGAAEVASGGSELLDPVAQPVTEELLASTEREAQAGAQIVIWSETAARTIEADAPALYEQVGEIANKYGIYVQVAAALYTPDPPHARNIITLIGPDGSVIWEYDKTHPLTGLEPIEPGDDDVPTYSTEHGVLAGMICYDLDYATSKVAADILLLPAADWEGFDTLHTQKSKLRAIEQGYSLVRQDAYGTAAAFDPQGRTLASVDYYETDQQTLVAEIPTQGRTTIYAAIGDVFAYACVAAMIGFVVLAHRRRRLGSVTH